MNSRISGDIPTPSFWHGKKVLVTGHTGFKGAWLTIWLSSLGATVTGIALEPPTNPSIFELCVINKLVESNIVDIRSGEELSDVMKRFQPEIVLHMAAQPIVRESYRNPVETYMINVMGTVNMLEAVRLIGGVRAVVNITTDKCYENNEWFWGYRENEPLGGYDPYSSSKACSELVTASFRNSFFNSQRFEEHRVGIATARAGNVIGGGDWAADRLIPDCVRSILNNETILIRNPYSIRPWQHVLEPLAGYLLLAEKLYNNGPQYAEAWNFGPDDNDARPVEWIVQRMCDKWGNGLTYRVQSNVSQPHEAQYLKLDCSKAKSRLNWKPRWNLDDALAKIIDWTKAYQAGEDMLAVCRQQIKEYSTGEGYYGKQ